MNFHKGSMVFDMFTNKSQFFHPIGKEVRNKNKINVISPPYHLPHYPQRSRSGKVFISVVPLLYLYRTTIVYNSNYIRQWYDNGTIEVRHM